MDTAGRKAVLAYLMSARGIDEMSDEEGLAWIARSVDAAGDDDSVDGLRRALALAEELGKRELALAHRAELHYFIANAWACIRGLSRKGTPGEWEWEQEELEQEIFNLRTALVLARGTPIGGVRLAQFHTNLANLLDHVGRPIEGLACWDEALRAVPGFPMAVGNRGLGLVHYARALYDDGHQVVLLREAHLSLGRALAKRVHPDAQVGFDDTRKAIERLVPSELLERDRLHGEFPLGESEEERVYRRWCLEHRLFLNPLNDLGPHPIAGRDVLHMPSVVLPATEAPFHYGFYNELKQEFVSARFLHHEAVNAERCHYSDRDVLLYDTLDGTAHGLATEKLKLSFRSAYSVFDKVAYFLNAYLQLGIAERRVSFRTLWYDGQERKRGLRVEFVRRENLPLRGLFWLSRDLFEDRNGFRRSIAPEARELDTIRNHLEHKYLKSHADLWPGPGARDGPSALCMRDPMACSVGRRELANKGLRLLQLVRAALIYLSLAVHVEERRQNRDRAGDPGAVLAVPMDVVQDERKR